MTVVIIWFDNLDDICHSYRMFIRRLGVDPASSVLPCAGGRNCPDLLELANGDFAVIGKDITEFTGQLPPGSGCGADERMVRIPRALLVRARADIAALA